MCLISNDTSIVPYYSDQNSNQLENGISIIHHQKIESIGVTVRSGITIPMIAINTTWERYSTPSNQKTWL